MTEGLFLITTLFVAYVVYVIINEKKAGNADKSSLPVAKKQESKAVMPEKAKPANTAALKAEPVKAAAAKPVAEKPAPKPVAAKTAAKPAPAKAAAKPAAKQPAAKAPEPIKVTEAPKGKGLKDPNSGEVVSSYTNYRFMKRWIKEALVAEGLVEKVYKNDELNASLEGTIREAIAKLEGMKKYQP